jgi:chemotaxis protein CheD
MPDPNHKNLARTFYYDRQFKCDAVKVLPGEYYFTNRNIIMTTVLGSCVAACVYDPLNKIGGMNHFLLPESSSLSATKPPVESMRYGSFAMDTLINDTLKLGAVRENLVAKVFGGGHVIEDMKTLRVGSRNAKFVVNYLNDKGIKIVAEDMEDVHPRKIYFSPVTGKVMVKKLKDCGFLPYVDLELTYRESIYKLMHFDGSDILK